MSSSFADEHDARWWLRKLMDENVSNSEFRDCLEDFGEDLRESNVERGQMNQCIERLQSEKLVPYTFFLVIATIKPYLVMANPLPIFIQKIQKCFSNSKNTVVLKFHTLCPKICEVQVFSLMGIE